MLPNFTKFITTKAGITTTDCNTIIERAIVKEYSKGKILLHKGETCQHAFFVEQGLLRMFSIDKEGKEHIVQFAAENWIITDRASVFFKEPSEFYIDVIEDCKVVLMNDDYLLKIAQHNKDFAKQNDYLLQNHIRHLQNRINLLISASAEERYLDFINLYPDLLLRAPQWMIASYLGITPESLSRVRKKLAERNFGK